MNSRTSTTAKAAASATVSTTSTTAPRSSVSGETGILSTLAKEHAKICSLLEQAVSTHDAKKKKETVDQIRVELVSHARAEAAIFYNALRGHSATRDVALCSREKHDELEELLSRLQHLSPGTHDYQRTLRTLQHQVEHHVCEEEQIVFPKADAVFTGENKTRLDEEFKTAKHQHRDALAA